MVAERQLFCKREQSIFHSVSQGLSICSPLFGDFYTQEWLK